MSVEYAWHDLLGNLGVLLIVGSYFHLQVKKAANISPIHSLVNACGAALVLITLRYDFNLSAALVESFWLLISLLGLFLRLRKSQTDTDPVIPAAGRPDTQHPPDS